MTESRARVQVLGVVSRWLTLIFFETTTAIYLITAGGRQMQTDAYAASLESWRIANGANPWLNHVDLSWVTRYIDVHYVYSWVSKNPGGHLVVYRSPGAVAASIPAYWIRGGGSSSLSYNPEAGNVTAALLTALAMTLLFSTVRRHVSTRLALLATGTLAFATPMWSVSSHWIYTHPVTVLGIAGMAWAADRDRWWLVGLFGGIGLWGRLHVAVIVAILGLGVALWRRDWRVAAKVAVPSGALLALAGVWSHWLYGSWFPSGGYGSSSVSALVTGNLNRSPTIGHGVVAKIANQLGLWLAPDRGVLVWTPIIIVLLPALARSWKSLPDWSRVLLVGGVVYALIQGQIDAFTGGDGFWGYRLMLEPLACAFPALTIAARSTGRAARSLIPWLLGLMFASTFVAAFAPHHVLHGMVYGWWLPEKDAWTNNAYVNVLGHGDIRAWVLLAVGVLIGLAGPRLWRRAGSGRPT